MKTILCVDRLGLGLAVQLVRRIRLQKSLNRATDLQSWITTWHFHPEWYEIDLFNEHSTCTMQHAGVAVDKTEAQTFGCLQETRGNATYSSSQQEARL